MKEEEVRERKEGVNVALALLMSWARKARKRK